MSDEAKFDVQTMVRLLAPKEIGLELVPLSDVNQAAYSFYWATIFWGLFTTLLGAWLSLLATDYSNTPVVRMLLVGLLIFLILFITFSIIHFLQRRKYTNTKPQSDNSTSKNDTGTSINDGLNLDQRRLIWRGLAYKLRDVLRNRVFFDSLILKKSTFLERFKTIYTNQDNIEELNGLVNSAIHIGILSMITSDDSTTYKLNVHYNLDIAADKFVQ